VPDALPAGTSRRWLMLSVLLIVAVTAVVRLPSFRVPLDQDGAVFAYCAQTWADGGLPYRDAWDHKLPLIYLVYRGLFALGPPSHVAVNTTLRLGGMACDAAVAVLLLFLAKRLFDRRAGLAAGLLYAVFAGMPCQTAEAFQPERLTVLFTAAAVLAAVAYAQRRRCVVSVAEGTLKQELERGTPDSLPRVSHPREGKAPGYPPAGVKPAGGALVYLLVAASGLLFGLALIAKQIAAPIGLVTWAWLAWVVLREDSLRAWRRVAIQSVLLGVGAVLPWAACAGYFAARGAFDDFWNCTQTFNVLYAQELRKGGLLDGLRQLWANRVYDHGFLWATGAAGLARMAVRGPERRAGLLVGGWMAAAFTGVFLPGNFANYYYIPTLAPLALASGLALAALWGLATRPMAWPARVVGVGLPVAVLLALFLFAAKRGYGDHKRATDPLDTNAAVADAARWLAAHTGPTDRLYVWGSRPQLYVLSGRKAVCRYLFNWYYDLAKKGQTERQKEDERRAYRVQQDIVDETLAGLRKYRPPYIVVTDPGKLPRFPDLKQYLEQNYDFGHVEREWPAKEYPPAVYKRKG